MPFVVLSKVKSTILMQGRKCNWQNSSGVADGCTDACKCNCCNNGSGGRSRQCRRRRNKSLYNEVNVIKLLHVLLMLFVYKCDIQVVALQRGKLVVPSSYIAQSNDLQVQLISLSPLTKYDQDLRLQISRFDARERVEVGIIDIFPDPFLNVTQTTISCQYFIRGGQYELEIVGNDINATTTLNETNKDERLRQSLDVRWPIAALTANTYSVATYPERSVKVRLEFEGVECQRIDPSLSGAPEFVLELVYCGRETICDSSNVTKSQVLYRESLRGLVASKIIELECELFGLAGNYVFELKPVSPVPAYVSTAIVIKADWSDKFVFNVHARSIFPCEPHSGGIGVLFEYPTCILDQSDRVRLYAKLRADVASLSPPTSLHYITEQRVIKGQHSLHFDCDLFSERFVEYCFVYVSQAISGAVADIRMDCVPTLPVSDSDTGGWSSFGNWSACSSSCGKGVRYRYRFCDSPPPRYGAKFCEGPSVQTEVCYGNKRKDSWECIYGEYEANSKTSVAEEIGPACRCGCIVHLGVAKPKRIIASSAQACPGRTFWLIQSDGSNRIQFKLDFFRLPCANQFLKIRDGDTLQSDLIGEYVGGMENKLDRLESSTSQILIEFYTENLSSVEPNLCGGGFLGHAQQISSNPVLTNSKQASSATASNVTISAIKNSISSHKLNIIDFKLTLAHVVAIIFVSFISLISLLLGIQYVFRYHRYQKTSREPDSPSHTPTASHPASRAMSTTTLISEVISMVKLRPKPSLKHTRLRESIDVDAMENHELAEIERSQSTNTLKATSNDKLNSKALKIVNKRLEKLGLSPPNETSSLPELTMETPLLKKRSAKEKPKSISNFETKSVNGTRGKFVLTPSPSSNEKDSVSEASEKHDDERSNCSTTASNTTLTNNGCYSPAPSSYNKTVIRTNNLKEKKEKSNREKMMATTGSEFSLTNPEELELDYYDYNVINSAAAPGSYLGMDPAFLVWIPPIDETAIDDEIEPHYEEILPRHSTPEEKHEPDDDNDDVDDDDVPTPKHQKSLTNTQQQEEIKSLLSKATADANELKKPAIEITDNRIADYYGLSDIQFADDVDDLDDEVRYIDENKAFHSSGRISENRYKV